MNSACRGLTLLNSFTWEHSLDNASASLEGNTPSPQDGNNIRADYAQSDYNLPIANITSLVYELPLAVAGISLDSNNGIVNTVLGGWQISGSIPCRQARPSTSPTAPTAHRPSRRRSRRRTAAPTSTAPTMSPARRLPGLQIAPPTPATSTTSTQRLRLPPIKDAAGNVLSPFGNASRNPGRTPAFYQTDLALNKKFTTPVESLKVEFRTEFYNLFNHTNLYLPAPSAERRAPPQQPSAPEEPLPREHHQRYSQGGGQITSTFQPRIIQFGLKVIY